MLRIVLLVLLLMPIAPASAADDPVKPINTDSNGLALKGYDPVAYLVDGRALQGSPALQHEWGGAVWRFATAANLELFKKAPDSYAPQFGGYCAWAVSRNYTADIDPEAFEIVRGKLYLNYSKLVQLRWKVQRDENIRKAEQNWPKLHAGSKGTK